MKKELFGFFTAMGLCAAAGPASATVFYIDEFTVTENGVTYWNDTFTNGIAPKDQDIESPAAVDVNKYDRAYLTRPYDYLPGPEAGGKLALDTALGWPNVGVVTPVDNLIQRARIDSAMSTSNPASLLATEQITVTALFDLIEPQQNGELYSIRLTDWAGDSTPEGVELAVVKTLDGDWLVQLRQAIIADHWDPIQKWNLGNIADIADFEQISLSLFNDPNDSTGGTGFGSEFILLDTNGSLDPVTRTSNVQGYMYEYEDWLRPEFTARLRVIPEPATLALLSLGLVGLGVQRRKSSV